MKKIYLAAAIFLGVFLVNTVPYHDWRFFDDDYAYAHVKNENIASEIKSYFSDNPNDRPFLPSNMRDDMKWSFFGVMYRPLTLVMYAAESYLFGPHNPHAYFLLSMAMHAACAVLIFFLFCLLVPLWYAFFGALCFAFYPIMGEFVGRLCMQAYSVSLLCVGLSVMLLKKYIDERTWWPYIASVLLFLLPLFMHEAIIVYPLWLVMVLPFYFSGVSFPGLPDVRHALVLSVPYFLVVAFNLTMRLLAYPLAMGSEYTVFNPSNFLARLKFRFFDFISLMIDATGLSSIPGGNRLRKGMALIFVLGVFVAIFVRSRRKREVILLALGFPIFTWPAFAMHHQARYLYLGIPFLLAANLVGMSSFSAIKNWKDRAVAASAKFAFLALIVSGGVYGAMSTKARQQRYIAVDNALRELALNPAIRDKPLCFVGVPKEWFAHPGIAQAIWIHRGDDSMPVYHDPQMNVHCLQVHNPLGEAELPRFDLLGISVVGNKVRIVSKDLEHAWMQTSDPFGKEIACTMGKLTVLSEENGRAQDVQIEIDDRWMRDNPVFVTWDFEDQKFKVVERNA